MTSYHQPAPPGRRESGEERLHSVFLSVGSQGRDYCLPVVVALGTSRDLRDNKWSLQSSELILDDHLWATHWSCPASCHCRPPSAVWWRSRTAGGEWRRKTLVGLSGHKQLSGLASGPRNISLKVRLQQVVVIFSPGKSQKSCPRWREIRRSFCPGSTCWPRGVPGGRWMCWRQVPAVPSPHPTFNPHHFK